ncbi:unnamed protein product, partial [Polarella glacialis]
AFGCPTTLSTDGGLGVPKARSCALHLFPDAFSLSPLVHLSEGRMCVSSTRSTMEHHHSSTVHVLSLRAVDYTMLLPQAPTRLDDRDSMKCWTDQYLFRGT